MTVQDASYPRPEPSAPIRLLAVDLGLKAGLAAFNSQGHLCWARSTHFGTVTRMKQALPSLLTPSLEVLVLEGDRQLASHWERLAHKRSTRVLRVTPERWRSRLLAPRQRRTGRGAKEVAISLAWQLFDDDQIHRPPTLRHDAAEAILIGLWAVLELRWRQNPPAFVSGQTG